MILVKKLAVNLQDKIVPATLVVAGISIGKLLVDYFDRKEIVPKKKDVIITDNMVKVSIGDTVYKFTRPLNTKASSN